MKLNKILIGPAAASLAVAGVAHAHIVSIGWNSLPGGSVEFKAQHWHGSSISTPDGFLLFDGVQYPFTGTIVNTGSISGFDGALINSAYATWNPGTGTITTLSDPNWLTVTVPNVGGGSHTLGSSDIALTRWTLDGNINTASLNFTPSNDSIPLLASSIRSSSLTASRATVHPVSGRLTALRSGVRAGTKTVSAPPAQSAKGGMEPKTPIVETYTCPWEGYGGIFYSAEDHDQQLGRGLGNPIIRPDTDITTFGGWVGFDYDFDENWTAGFAISGSRSDVDMNLVGTSDIDTLALVPYVSYYRDAGNYAAWADLLYAYGMNDYDTFRLPSVIGDTDGNFHNVEFNTGVNFTNGSWVHGPLAQFRWLDGDIDGYQETGLGGVIMPEQSYKSIATQLGYQTSYRIDTASGMVVVPNAKLAWEHEFEADQGNFLGVPLGDVDEDLLVVGVGVGCYNGCGWNVALDYQGRFGSDYQGHYVGAKFGYEF